MTPSKHSLYEQEGSEVELSATNVARWDTAFSGKQSLFSFQVNLYRYEDIDSLESRMRVVDKF